MGAISPIVSQRALTRRVRRPQGREQAAQIEVDAGLKIIKRRAILVNHPTAAALVEIAAGFTALMPNFAGAAISVIIHVHAIFGVEESVIGFAK